MRNAEASIDPPTDPFAAVSPPVPPKKHPVRPASASLPRGVSADIFGSPAAHPTPAQPVPRQGGLPPASPIEPWPMADKKVREEPPPVARLDPGPEPKGHALRYALIAVFVLGLLAYLVPAMFMAGQVLPRTTVLGVDIGGLTAAQAVQTLRDRLEGQTRTPVVVRQGTLRVTVTPEEAGLQFDPEETVKQISIGFPTPREVWSSLTGGLEVRPRISVDRAKLAAAVSQTVAPVFDKPAQEGGVKFRGLTPVATYPKPGRKIDQAQVGDEIQNAYLSTDVMVEVTSVREDPEVSDDEVTAKLDWAKRAVSAPITLTNGTRSVQLPVEALAANLTFVPDEGASLRPRFDGVRAIAYLERRLIDPAVAARDATFSIQNGRPTLVPSKPGESVDGGRLAEDVIKAMQGGSRTVPVSLISGPARLADDEASNLGIEKAIGRFTTSYACCLPRVANIKTVATVVSGSVIRPGETFSLNEVVGRRDASTGYAGDITTTVVDGTTGSDVAGISQFATTLFNAVIRAGLEDVKHTPHEVYMPQYPAGLEAMMSYPGPDLQWRNDSPYGVLVQAVASDTSLTVTLWSTKRYDVELRDPVKTNVIRPLAQQGSGPNCVPVRGQAGFKVKIVRVLKQRGKVLEREPFTTVYRPQAQITCPATG